jgi:uncharacterized Rmd1/YagE family protein
MIELVIWKEYVPFMNCFAYCVGKSYQIYKIADIINAEEVKAKIFDREVLYVEADALYVALNGADKHKPDKHGKVFIFNYGCVVFWGLPEPMCKHFLKIIRRFLLQPLAEPVMEKCKFDIDETQESYVDEEQDVIFLEKADYMLQLSFSYGLSQSVKLDVFESYVNKTISENERIPQELVRTGKISLSRKALAKKTGNLFLTRYSINLNSDILDTPDFFWRRPKYEPYYQMSVDFLDIEHRVEVLNQRLNIIHELYEVVSTELQHLHSSRLEWIIIILIMMEVLIGVLKL